MVQFVNIREFKTKTESILKRLEKSDIILTVQGRPKALLHKITERDISVDDFTSEDLDNIEELAKEPVKSYKTAAEAKKHLDRLVR